MPDGMEFDFSDILKLSADLGEVPDSAGKFIRKAVEVTARNVRDAWREPLKASSTIPGGDRTISYDLAGGEAVRGSEIVAEIGPEARGKGSHWVGGLVGALEYGIPGKAGPTGYGAAALEKNQADFRNGLEIAISDAQKAAGL